MNILENLKGVVKNHFEKRKEQREAMEKMQAEVSREAQVTFEIEFKKHAREIAIGKAKKDAARLSGAQKLRAENRLRNLSQNLQSPGTFFDKLSEYTQKNIARREENLQKTKMMRGKGEEIKTQRLQGRTVPIRKPFGTTSTWKM